MTAVFKHSCQNASWKNVKSDIKIIFEWNHKKFNFFNKYKYQDKVT